MAKKTDTGNWTVYNIFRDHLGTITHLKDASTGTVTEYSFDAWGRRRDKDTWSYTLDAEPILFADRGFTGHEYLEDFKLYNMNGRLYDPVVGRFLSPDPYIQDPGFTQSMNRYSYCLNNPLKFTDPSGNTWWSKFWNWTAEHGIQFGINIGPGGNVPNISAPGPGNTRVAAGVNTQTGLVGVGNNSSGFMNFYFPGYNYDVAAQNADELIKELNKSYNKVREFTRNGIWTIGLTGTASAGIGGSIELGATLDFRNGFAFGLYFSLEETYGADLSAGAVLNYHKPINNGTNFNISDLNGWGESTNGAIWIFDGIYGGNAYKSGLHPENFSDYHSLYETYGFGISAGSPLGFSIHKGYTWTTQPLINWQNENRSKY